MEKNSNMEGKVTCTLVQREVDLSSISAMEERDMTKVFLYDSTKAN